MTLREWLARQPRGKQQEIARIVGVSETWMSLLVNGKGRPSAELANVLHSLTNGEVPREELRPDIFKVPT